MYDTRRSRVAWLLFFTRCDVFCDLLQYTRTGKCNLFYWCCREECSLLKDFGAWKKKDKSADVIWHGFDVICVVCPLIDHGHQPMKMHTEVTLLYKKYCCSCYPTWLLSRGHAKSLLTFLMDPSSRISVYKITCTVHNTCSDWSIPVYPCRPKLRLSSNIDSFHVLNLM